MTLRRDLELLVETRAQPWRDRAACHGMDPALWFPEREPDGDNHGRAGKAICAQCPVAADCLEAALAVGEKQGIQGGASPRIRKQVMAGVWAHRRHRYDPACRDPKCTWCRLVDGHLAHLRGDTVGPTVTHGPTATHGRRSTYARGCRCGPCMFAASTAADRLLRDADFVDSYDLPEWWAESFGPDDSPTLLPVVKAKAISELSDAPAPLGSWAKAVDCFLGEVA